MSHFIQEQSSEGSGQGSFTTITETLNWSRLWTPELRTTLRGGGSLKLPVGSDIPGQSTKSQLVPTVSAAMTYTSFSEELRDAGASGPFDSLLPLAGNLSPGGIMPPGAYTVAANYRYGLGPSYAFGAGPLQGACGRRECSRRDHVQSQWSSGIELFPWYQELTHLDIRYPWTDRWSPLSYRASLG